mgnify:CR=1 FL=1
MIKEGEVSPFPMEIGRVQKTKKDVYIVSINEYNGKIYIDVRLHYFIGEEVAPTKKGITLNLRTFEPTVKLLLEAYKKFEELQKDEVSKDDDSKEP